MRIKTSGRTNGVADQTVGPEIREALDCPRNISDVVQCFRTDDQIKAPITTEVLKARMNECDVLAASPGTRQRSRTDVDGHHISSDLAQLRSEESFGAADFKDTLVLQ